MAIRAPLRNFLTRELPCCVADSYCYRGNPKVSRLDALALAHRLVLLELVAELPEGHLEEFGGLGLHATRAIERSLQIPALDGVEGGLEIETILRDVDTLQPLHRTFAPHGLGQRFHADHVLPAEHDGPLQHVLQLADVARPVVALEHRHGLRGHSADVLPQFLAELLQEMGDEERDVFPALAEGWELDGNHVQSIEEVLAQDAFLH